MREAGYKMYCLLFLPTSGKQNGLLTEYRGFTGCQLPFLGGFYDNSRDCRLALIAITDGLSKTEISETKAYRPAYYHIAMKMMTL